MQKPEIMSPPSPNHLKPSNGYHCNDNKTQISYHGLQYNQWTSKEEVPTP